MVTGLIGNKAVAFHSSGLLETIAETLSPCYRTAAWSPLLLLQSLTVQQLQGIKLVPFPLTRSLNLLNKTSVLHFLHHWGHWRASDNTLPVTVPSTCAGCFGQVGLPFVFFSDINWGNNESMRNVLIREGSSEMKLWIIYKVFLNIKRQN